MMLLLTPPEEKKGREEKRKQHEPRRGWKAAPLTRCRGRGTYALGLGKPMDSSTSRLEPHLMEPGRFCRSLRGRILL